MPVHLPPTTRRSFITQLGAAVTICPYLGSASAALVDDDIIAILNDSHIGAKQPLDSPIPSNLRDAVAFLVGSEKRPAAVLINGDLALRDGQSGDYELFAKLIAPLRDAGIPVHLTMGNHDERNVFYRVLAGEKPASPPVVARHVAVVQLPQVNLFLLDSLKQTMIAPGDLGAEQLHWLGQALDAHRDKPALIVAHHNPRLGGDPKHFPGGLEDSEALWQILTTRPQVKAYIHGHIHHRDFFQHQGIHILNTPAVGYVGDKTQSTTGWTMMRVATSGATITTHTHLADHPWNNAEVKLTWRS